MTIEEAGKVLGMIAAGDQRTVGEADLLFWAQVLPDWIELEDALTAVTIHFRRSHHRIMPVDVIRASKEARAQRLGYALQEGL